MPSITAPGIGSGLDLGAVIDVYLRAEREPAEAKLNARQTRVNSEISGVGQLKSALAKFQAATAKLADAKNFDKSALSITGTSASAIEVSALAASNGNFSVEVLDLAKGSRLSSTPFASSTSTVGAGTLTFAVGSESVNVAIDATDTLQDIRRKVNEQVGGLGVSANLINSDSGTVMAFTSSTTGAANSLQVTATGDAGLAQLSTDLNQDQLATDARISIDGAVVSSSSNTFKNAIQGLTITAKSLTAAGSPAQLSVVQDKGAVETMIKDFVSAYNDLVGTLENLGRAKTGALAFDPLVRQTRSQIQQAVSGEVSGMPQELNSLYQLGVTFTNDGRMEISPVGLGTSASGTERLDNALSNRFSDVGMLFAGDNGLATKVDGILDTYLASDGAVTKRQSSLTESLQDISKQREALELRLTSLEATLTKRYTALDSVVAQYQSTSDWLTSTLKSLNASTGGNK